MAKDKKAVEPSGARIVPDSKDRWLLKNTSRMAGQYVYQGKFVELLPGKHILLDEVPTSLTRELRVTLIKGV